jgi:hypothetical protein
MIQFDVVKRRARKLSALFALALGVAGISGTSEGCRTATQVELVVTYDGMCSDLQEVAFIIGTDPSVAEGRIESNVFTTTTTHCEQGSPSRVGTLVVTPNDATGRASIIVLASFGQHVSECKPEKGYADCIIARRAFAFVDHTALTLEIPLERSCKDVPCDAVSTCKHASCVSSNVACAASGCSEVGVIADGGTELVDAPMDPDAYIQGHPDAAPPQLDGSIDAPTDGPSIDAPFDGPAETGTGPDGGSCSGGPSLQPVSCKSQSSGLKICSPMSPVCCVSDVAVATPDGGSVPPGYTCRAAGSCVPTMQDPSVSCRSSANCPLDSVCCINHFSNAVSCTTPGTRCIGGGMSVQACNQDCECQANEQCAPGLTLGTMPSQGAFEVCQPKPAQP